MNLEHLFGSLVPMETRSLVVVVETKLTKCWHVMNLELMLTKRVTADEGGFEQVRFFHPYDILVFFWTPLAIDLPHCQEQYLFFLGQNNTVRVFW